MKDKKTKTLTQKLLEFFRQRKAVLLNEFIKLYPDKTQSVYSLVNRFKRQGLLEKVQPAGTRQLRSFFRLTPKGQEKLEKTGVAIKVPKKVIKWDGVWRLLIFDIPEEKKSTREYLRRELKARSFYMLQLSVWITPYEVDEELQEIIEDIGARYYVRFMVVKEINYEKDLLRFFKLQFIH